MSSVRISTPVTTLSVAGLALLYVTPVHAHVDYVTEESGSNIDPFAFLVETISHPTNLLILGGTGVFTLIFLGAYFRVRPTVKDIVVLRETISGYGDFIPWLLRLSIGLPLVGAGFAGYAFSPAVPFDTTARPVLRLFFLGLGFCILFGMLTRIFSTVGLVAYLITLLFEPGVLLALEYVPVFLVLLVLGGGRPSVDDMLQHVASTEGTIYGRIDPIHHVKRYLDEKTTPYRRLVPTIIRVGMGAIFVYLGLTQKLRDPARSLAVVEKYNLTQVVPVDPGLWVLGAALGEIAVGMALIAGFLTRANAAAAFMLFTLTLFGLPDDPVLSHVTLFGMASAVFGMGAGPLSFDEWAGRPVTYEDESVVSSD